MFWRVLLSITWDLGRRFRIVVNAVCIVVSRVCQVFLLIIFCWSIVVAYSQGSLFVTTMLASEPRTQKPEKGVWGNSRS